MPGVLPFRGVRYPAADPSDLVCPPYDVIGPHEQRELQAQSSYNAVHLELPEDRPGEPGSRYAVAAERLASWRKDGILRPDARPAYYLVETEFEHAGRPHRRRDLLAALVVEPWSAKAVLPHEHTMAGPKADRLELLRATHLNISPIWVLHAEPLGAVETAWKTVQASSPAVDFTWRGERRRMWVVDDSALVAAIQAGFATGGPLYIADGHHRYETGLAFRQEAEAGLPGACATLATVTWADDSGLVVLPTHRLLHGLDPALRLEAIESRFGDVFHLEYYPVWENHPPEQIDAFMQQLASSGRAGPSFGVFGFGHLDLFGLLELRGRKPPPDALPKDRSEAWKALDVSVLHSLFLDPLIQETGRPRVEVLSYTRDPHAAIAAVRDGAASAAVFLNPTPVSGVFKVADAQDRMPEKSTYFHPKPPAGLVMRDLSLWP